MTDLSMRAIPKPAPLRQQVVDNLRAAIVDGRFKPGDRLVERDLCAATGVSRTLVREALRQLEAEQLVEVLANKGPIVATIGLDEARSIYQVRGVLEALASRLAAENGTPAQKRLLRQRFQKFAAACRSGNAAEAGRTKNDLYLALFDCTGNRVLESQLQLIFARTSLLRATTLASPGRLKKSLAEIEVLIKAVEDGNGDKAWAASLAHVAHAGAALTAILTAS